MMKKIKMRKEKNSYHKDNYYFLSATLPVHFITGLSLINSPHDSQIISPFFGFLTESIWPMTVALTLEYSNDKSQSIISQLISLKFSQ